MLNNMNFYNFMHKQILVVIALFAGTGLAYAYIASLYATPFYGILWYSLVVAISFWGYRLHRLYKNSDLNIQEKDKWLKQVKYFLFSYFSLWTIIFIIYTAHNNIELHYLAIATQLGASVVSATILVSQRKLAIITLVTLMIPLVIYFILINEIYGYLLAFFTIVLSGVLLYASSNTYNYLVKSLYQAYHDYLTRIGNRRYFIELLEDSIKIQKKNNKFMYLLLIDLDHFKTINDTLGHDIGDLLLCEVSNRMTKLSEENNSNVSRLGGDEFCILSSFYDTKKECLDNAVNFSNILLKVLKEIYIVDEHHLYISASVGVSLINNPKMQANMFIKEADIAMYEAKAQGRDGVILFNEELSKNIEYKLEIERLLHFALQKNEIYLNYQPQINKDSKVLSCEVLARWNNDKLGNVPPDEFITVAENTGFIIELGLYILEESFKTLKDLDDQGIHLKHMSINISMRQLFHNTFVDDVKRLSKQYLGDKLTSKIIFEITETSVAEDIDKLNKCLNTIKKLGINFSMDDFGTGYSSLSYLSQIQISELKIDKSFISKLDDSEQDRTMVKTILSIAENLNLVTVAEGVETLSQEKFLIEQNCNILQGYYFSKPISKSELEQFILNY